GGSENMGIQYSLPDSSLGAGRDLEGVRRCILHAVQHAQGMGCAPGILGVAIGGDRATGYKESKRMLLRRIGERSGDEALAALERRVLADANSLGIGPMGFGGRTTLLDVFIGWLCRVPASYFVSVSYMCWCCRRQEITIGLENND
ncbi:MAG: fumarate hydratase, partial [Victivallales bacterium]|nr:fumarate hydratase [Victivallales bacterium]